METAGRIFLDLLQNPVFLSAAAAWFTAQLLKILIEICAGRFTADRLTGSGGMPSSHSATMVGLTTGAMIVHSARSTEFAIALFLTFVVIYDACGVRRETGREAEALNRLMDRDRAEGKDPLYPKRLKEQMGHTLPEIIAGIAIGIALALVVCLGFFHLGYPL